MFVSRRFFDELIVGDSFAFLVVGETVSFVSLGFISSCGIVLTRFLS